jgi:hypothetical protein
MAAPAEHHPMAFYHYTKAWNVGPILKAFRLLAAPPLAYYGLRREDVEADPGRYGFKVLRRLGRRVFVNFEIAHPPPPGAVSSACWFEGERFAVGFTRADWCGSSLGYFGQEWHDAGLAFRLTVDLGGLDAFGWTQYQQRTNTPAESRRSIGRQTVEMGDDPHDWVFVAGEVPLAGRLLEVEQYHTGRWTSHREVCERLPLRELYLDRDTRRGQFRAVFERTDGRHGASLFVNVCTADNRLCADHLWVRQSWPHLSPGDVVQFFATVVPYTRKDRSVGWTLADVNGLIREK